MAAERLNMVEIEVIRERLENILSELQQERESIQKRINSGLKQWQKRLDEINVVIEDKCKELEKFKKNPDDYLAEESLKDPNFLNNLRGGSQIINNSLVKKLLSKLDNKELSPEDVRKKTNIIIAMIYQFAIPEEIRLDLSKHIQSITNEGNKQILQPIKEALDAKMVKAPPSSAAMNFSAAFTTVSTTAQTNAGTTTISNPKEIKVSDPVAGAPTNILRTGEAKSGIQIATTLSPREKKAKDILNYLLLLSERSLSAEAMSSFAEVDAVTLGAVYNQIEERRDSIKTRGTEEHKDKERNTELKRLEELEQICLLIISQKGSSSLPSMSINPHSPASSSSQETKRVAPSSAQGISFWDVIRCGSEGFEKRVESIEDTRILIGWLNEINVAIDNNNIDLKVGCAAIDMINKKIAAIPSSSQISKSQVNRQEAVWTPASLTAQNAVSTVPPPAAHIARAAGGPLHSTAPNSNTGQAKNASNTTHSSLGQ